MFCHSERSEESLLLFCHSERSEEPAVVLSFRPQQGTCCCFVIPSAARNLLLFCHSERSKESASSERNNGSMSELAIYRQLSWRGPPSSAFM